MSDNPVAPSGEPVTSSGASGTPVSDLREAVVPITPPEREQGAAPAPSSGDNAATAIRLRAMREADLPAIATLERELFGGEAWSETVLAKEFEASRDLPGSRADRSYVVVESETQAGPARPNKHDAAPRLVLLGYAGLWVGDGRGNADLLTIATVPAARRRGIARLMLRELIGRAREAGCEAMLLEVRASNVAAQALYTSEGFTRIGMRRRYYVAPVEDALVMRLLLRGGPGPVGAEVAARLR